MIRHRKAENALSIAYIESMKAEGKAKKCPNCTCLIEGYGHVKLAKCTRCNHSFPWNGAVDGEGGELAGGEGSGGAERGGEERKRVAFTQDEATFRLIRPQSTELGPETVGKGPPPT
jgi:hypothetical protein